VRSLGRYGACCARGLWKIAGLFTDRLARFCRLFSERVLRWREGSICCAVSRRYRNAVRLSRKTLSAFCCVRGRVRSASRDQGGGALGRGESGRSRSNARRRAGTRAPHLQPVRLPPRATWRSQPRAYGASPGHQETLDVKTCLTGRGHSQPLPFRNATGPPSCWL